MKNSLIITAFFVAGVATGIFVLLPEFIIETDLSSYALYILMFFVGISIGADKGAWKIIKRAKFKIVLVPLSVIAGTFLGVGLISFFLPGISLKDAITVGAGFGYYSLSSILITQSGAQILGV
ncbi:MAG TPA: lysine exporter LysO family protein, partial [bacterium]|nr:lysine exporter LysO family protein [bacterium]